MTIITKVLSQLGHTSPAADIRSHWSDLMNESSAGAEPEYYRCYPEPLLTDIASFCVEGADLYSSKLESSFPLASFPRHQVDSDENLRTCCPFRRKKRKTVWFKIDLFGYGNTEIRIDKFPPRREATVKLRVKCLC